MKALQQEIVDALKIGATRCEDLRDCCDEFSRFTYIYNDESLKLRQLAAKVESARCENCQCYDTFNNYCDKTKLHMATYDICWSFEPNEKPK